VAELTAKTPCDGLLPLTIGVTALNEVDPGTMTSLAPYKGQEAKLSAALKATHGMAYPAANRATGKSTARAIWFGRDQAMLVGPKPDTSLSAHAAVVDQSDAWAVVRLQGAGAEDVLARLVPVDLRAAQFKRGHTVRSQLQHMNVSITRIAADAFQIMAFRSMAQTLVHDLKTAMEGVAARG
jgi:methylglutamate dehydrogenase subunit D